MSQARCNARRRRQAVNMFAHLGGAMRRPRYRRKALANLQIAIAIERQRAARMARSAKSGK